jgi:hypothetical protein
MIPVVFLPAADLVLMP